MSGVSGRFMGRDSMKFVSGMSMYSNFFFVTNTDPSGNFQLREYPSLELTSLVRQDPTVGILNPLPKPIEPSLPLDFPKLSNRNCAEFLRGFRTRHPIDPELSCNPNVYCAQVCNVGRGPGNSSQVVGGRCHICLNTSQNMNWLEWQAILIHELTHCTHFRRDHNCPCNKDAYVVKTPIRPCGLEVQLMKIA